MLYGRLNRRADTGIDHSATAAQEDIRIEVQYTADGCRGSCNETRHSKHLFRGRVICTRRSICTGGFNPGHPEGERMHGSAYVKDHIAIRERVDAVSLDLPGNHVCCTRR
jgi:hypothetical protein